MKNTLCGYMTVEASLVMPIVWFCLFLMIFAGFFQYDRCIAEQDGKIIVLRASEMRGKSETEVIRKVMEESELAGKKKLLFSNSVQKELHMSGDGAAVKISGKVNTILNGLLKGSNLNFFAYMSEYEAENYDPVQFIRLCRKVEKYAGN